MSITAFHPLTHRPAAEARLSAALTRPRLIAVACVVTLAGAGWGVLGLMASDIYAVLCRPGATAGWLGFAFALPMWGAMTLAMMLPTAGPMILTYAEIADTAARKGEPVVSPLVLTAGYIAVWLGFALFASLLQAGLARGGLFVSDALAPTLSGALVLGAGLYQFSSLKRRCLTLCQRPFPFFFLNWTDEASGVFRLGFRQGLACLGCCAALMLLMFAAGVMNVVWMALLGIVMTIEKMSTTPRFSRALGILLTVSGASLIAASMV